MVSINHGAILNIGSINKLSVSAQSPRASSAWLPALVGVVAFFIIAGPQFLDPTNVAWLVGGDPLQHYLGWAFFRNSPWTWPLGLNPLYGMNFSNSIVFTDSIPLLAIPFKLISPYLPYPFQYLGIWVLLCFILQAFFAYRLIGLFCRSTFLQCLGSIFFVFSPPLIFRLSLHESLMGHFLILAALYLNLKSKETPNKAFAQSRHSLAWVLLLSFSVLVHFYLAVMVLVLWLSDLASRVLSQKITSYKAATSESIVMVGVVSFVAWQAGYFSIEGASGGTRGFGDFRTNALALFNSRGWSYWLRPIPLRNSVEAATGEGFQYLGVGSLLILLSAVFAVMKGRFNLRQYLGLAWKDYPFLIGALVLLTLLSFSNHIGFGPWSFTIPLPDFLLSIFSIVRASSRLFWPMYYIVLLTIIFVVLKSYTFRTSLWIIGITALMQIVDTSAGWMPIREKVAVTASAEFKTTLQNPFWKSAGKHYQNIVSNGGQENWEALGIFASANQMATNIAYLARIDAKRAEQSFADVNEQLHKQGGLNAKTLYVLPDWKSSPDKIQYDPTKDLLAKLDGMTVLAPGWKACVNCPQVPKEFELPELAPPLEVGQVVEFTKAGNGRSLFMLGGWGFTEEWGTWAVDSNAKVIMPMPKGDPAKLIIHANAFLSPQHPLQVVDIAVNGARVADHMVLTKSKGNTLEVKLPRGSKLAGEPVMIEFRSLDPISPRQAGLGADDRKLGIGLVSIQFAP
jgi:hypothetical protein